jgi:probable FeS assembly SUF system protein SufT
MREARVLSRDIEAVVIPYGDPMSLTTGTTLYITQALGGSWTAMTDRGYMVRIEGSDGDAIGEKVALPPNPGDFDGRPLKDVTWELLRTCYDPEIPVNIVDLGLVYGVDTEAHPEGGENLTVRFTLTAPGCGMGDYLKQDVEQKVRSIPGVREAKVELVLDPPWSQDMMSDAARLQLGFM